MRRSLALAVALLCLAGAASGAESPSLVAGVFEPARLAPDFSLQGSDGATLTLSRYRGKVVVLAFGFTSCADVCPVTLGVLAAARKQLGPAAGDAQIVYVTVDPERDDAARMKSYLANFDASFVGGTGSAKLRCIAALVIERGAFSYRSLSRWERDRVRVRRS